MVRVKLSTGSRGNREFCFPKDPLNVPQSEAGPVIKCFVIPPNSDKNKAGKKHLLVESWQSKFATT